MPDENIEVVTRWAKNNPEYEVSIWIDIKIAPKMETVQFIKDMSALGIKVKDISEEGICRPSIRHELDQESPNYGMISDTLRFNVLKKEGGIYLDSDVHSNMPLPDQIKSAHGFLLSPWSQGKTAFCNDILMCAQGNQLVSELADAIEQSYLRRGLLDSKDPEYEKLSQRAGRFDTRRFATTMLATGPAFLFHELKKRSLLNEKALPDAIHWEEQDLSYLIDETITEPPYFAVDHRKTNYASWVSSNKRPGQGSRYLVIDFSHPWPKSTRQRAKLKGRDRPASGTLP